MDTRATAGAVTPGTPVTGVTRSRGHAVMPGAGGRSNIHLVHDHDSAALRTGRDQLISHGIRLLDDGLAVGSAGNLSMRLGDVVLITPSGAGYRQMRAADICEIGLDGSPLRVPMAPSSETPMHLAIYAATDAGAVVHTHSAEVIALSAVRDDLPAIHYAIADLGGPVRVAPYQRFGSRVLAQAAVTALADRRAAILRNHGAITYGASLAEAYDRALLLEWLARVHRLAISAGSPRILSASELEEVVAEARRIGYGTGGSWCGDGAGDRDPRG